MKGLPHQLAYFFIVASCAIASSTVHAQIYKCRQLDGALLYTDAPCGELDAKTISYLPRAGDKFISASQSRAPDAESDSAIQQEVTMLSAEEADLSKELEDIRAAPGESMNASPMAHAQRLAIMARLKAIHNKKDLLLGRGLSREDNEELVNEPNNVFEEGYLQ